MFKLPGASGTPAKTMSLLSYRAVKFSCHAVMFMFDHTRNPQDGAGLTKNITHSVDFIQNISIYVDLVRESLFTTTINL